MTRVTTLTTPTYVRLDGELYYAAAVDGDEVILALADSTTNGDVMLNDDSPEWANIEVSETFNTVSVPLEGFNWGVPLTTPTYVLYEDSVYYISAVDEDEVWLGAVSMTGDRGIEYDDVEEWANVSLSTDTTNAYVTLGS